MEWITPSNAFLRNSNNQLQTMAVWIARDVILSEPMTKAEGPEKPLLSTLLYFSIPCPLSVCASSEEAQVHL
jgi:hypothetical protein